MRLQNELPLFLGLLDQLIGGAVSLDADQNPNLLGLCEHWMKLVKPTQEEVPYEAIEEARLLSK